MAGRPQLVWTTHWTAGPPWPVAVSRSPASHVATRFPALRWSRPCDLTPSRHAWQAVREVRCRWEALHSVPPSHVSESRQPLQQSQSRSRLSRRCGQRTTSISAAFVASRRRTNQRVAELCLQLQLQRRFRPLRLRKGRFGCLPRWQKSRRNWSRQVSSSCSMRARRKRTGSCP